jgi:mono/diheme cytochrome c family protein
MRRLIPLLLILAVPLAVAGFLSAPPAAAAPAADGGGAPDGKAVFVAQKCNTCHAVSTAGIEATTKSDKMKGPDLVGLAADHDAAALAAYLKKETKIDDKAHRTAFKGSDAELDALVAWLLKQKK